MEEMLMAKYTYETATGPVEIEVDSHWAEVLKSEDTKEELNNRKHTRPDHKYAPGGPLSLDSLKFEGACFEDHDDCIAAVELSIDIQRALESLTILQRRYFIMNRFQGYTLAEIADLEGKCDAAIYKTVRAAERKMKEYFRDR
jgi:DNA-directed RNA polymerase specialized sigma24 family protein